MIKDTAYNLELHLQRIDEKMTQSTVECTDAPSTGINLEDEREVTKQCLLICEDARSYIESLSNRESDLLEETLPPERNTFEAQLRTRQALSDNLESFGETIGRLQQRLDSLVRNDGAGNEEERSRLLSDIHASKQCLDVCKMASEISRQKVYRIGEVIAEGDSDQVVVTTLADLFDIKKAYSKGTSAQLVGSMSGEELRLLTEKRYSSRFGAVAGKSVHVDAGNLESPSVYEVHQTEHSLLPQANNLEQSTTSRTKQNRPSPNEMRKRLSGGATD